MARMPIEIIDLRRSRDRRLSEIIDAINGAQTCYVFSALENSKAIDLAFAVREDTNISHFMPNFISRRTEWRGYHPFIVCLFDTAINDSVVSNLFSVDLVQNGFAAFTLHNVEKVLIPSDKMDSYLIYYFGFFALKFTGVDLPFHKENRGCIYDYRHQKTGIVDTIRTGFICDKCKDTLVKNNYRLSSEQFTSLFAILGLASKIIKGETSIH
jgi:hypothetical protein